MPQEMTEMDKLPSEEELLKAIEKLKDGEPDSGPRILPALLK